jgi:hypothetical protein
VQFARAVRGAKPGTSLYVPRPYPTANADVIADFQAYLISAYGRETDPNRGRFGVIADGLRNGIYEINLFRVEDWSPARCADSDGGGDTYFLLVLRDKTTHAEAARGTVHESGIVGQMVVPFEGVVVEPMDSLVPAMNAELSRKGVTPRELKYVSTWGTVDCDRTRPCVAARTEAGRHT